MINLAIDVGNTLVKMGIFKEGKLLFIGKFTSHPVKEVDEWGILLSDWIKQFGEKFKVEKAILSSVVPTVSTSLKKALERYLKLSSFEVTPEKVRIPLLYDNPRQIGTDRIANAVALTELYKLPAIAIDFGTATTFDVVSEKGEYLGGVIAPGVEVSLKSLSKETEKLFLVEFKRPDRVIGRSTKDNLISGIFYSSLGAVKEIIRGIDEEIGQEARVIATGGLGALMGKECDQIDEVNPLLTLQGLNFIGEKWA